MIILLTRIGNSADLYINVNHLVSFYSSEVSDDTIVVVGDISHRVQENPEEILQKIQALS